MNKQHSTEKSLPGEAAAAQVIAVAQNPGFLRRIGPDPHENGQHTYACLGCPDIWELDNGDFAVIGSDISEAKLPPTASCGPDERIVRIPRKTLVLAKADIPDRL